MRLKVNFFCTKNEKKIDSEENIFNERFGECFLHQKTHDEPYLNAIS